MKKDDKVIPEMSRSVDIAYTAIREAILTGELEEGSALVEKELAVEIGVSRTPVREALNKLRNESLVVLERYRKNYVAYFTEEERQETLEIKAMLEGYAAGRAALRISEDSLARLEELDTLMSNVLNLDDATAEVKFYQYNEEFHQIILDASQSKRAIAIVSNSLGFPFRAGSKRPGKLKSYLRRACMYHREILNAIKAQNAELANRQMQSHVLSLLNDDVSG